MDIWHRSIGQDSETLASMTGRFLTESGNMATGMSSDEDLQGSLDRAHWQVTPFSRVAWRKLSEDRTDNAVVELFVDGEAFRCSRRLAVDLCRLGQGVNAGNKSYTSADRQLLEILVSTGSLVPHDGQSM